MLYLLSGTRDCHKVVITVEIYLSSCLRAAELSVGDVQNKA